MFCYCYWRFFEKGPEPETNRVGNSARPFRSPRKVRVSFIGDPGGTTRARSRKSKVLIHRRAVVVYRGYGPRWRRPGSVVYGVYTDYHEEYDYGLYCPDSGVFLVIVIFVNYPSVLRRSYVTPCFFRALSTTGLVHRRHGFDNTAITHDNRSVFLKRPPSWYTKNRVLEYQTHGRRTNKSTAIVVVWITTDSTRTDDIGPWVDFFHF